MEPDQQLKATAYHEAGHGVIAYRFGHLVWRLSIAADDARLGVSSSEGAWADGSRDREQVIVLFSGFAAERRFDPNAIPAGSAHDDEEAAELLAYLPTASEAELRDEAKQLVDENWRHIEAVATALLEHTTIDDWTIIVDSIDEGEDWRPNLDIVLARQRELN